MAYTRLPAANFSLIASNNIYTGNNYGITSAYCLFVNDDDSVVFMYENSSSYDLFIYVYDKSGKFTYYKYHEPVVSNNIFSVNIIPFGFGKFIVNLSSGTTLFLTLSNAKLNNPIPFNITNSALVTTPCYGPPTKFFYDAKLNILACSSYDPLGQNGGPVFDAEYAVNENSVILLCSGYTGNYYTPSNEDPFDYTKIGLNGSLVYSAALNQSNGISSSLVYGSSQYYIGKNIIGVSVGSTTGCNTLSNAPKTGSYAYSRNFMYNYFVNNAYQGFSRLLDSNIYGINGSYNDYGLNNNLDRRIEVFDENNNVLDIPTLNNPYNPVGIVITKSHIFFLDSARQNLYISEYNFYNPIPNLHPYIINPNDINSSINGSSNPSPQATQLINFHRPVSILGKYKA